jgi:hypothetical protein
MANIKKDGSYTTRHRGAYHDEHPAPFELSRGKIEALIRCPACFWLEKRAGVKPIDMPGFNLNTNTDTLLKRDFDQYRGIAPHPIMKAFGLGQLRPFAHDQLNKWTSSTQFGASAEHFNTVHEPTNILFGGGVDDVWENSQTGELHIVDYKSTAQLSQTPKPLDEEFLSDHWKAAYKRQAEMYQWILRRRGHTVSNIAYFVYVDGQHVGETGMLDESDPTRAAMQFNAAIIPYEGSDHWVEDRLFEAKKTLESVQQPMHGSGCDVARFLSQTLLFSTPNPLINSAASALPKDQMLQQQLKAKLSPKMQELLSEDQKSRRKFDTSRSEDRLFSFLFTNKIICPKPISWQKQYETIASIYDKEERAFELHLPLIRAGWSASSANEKRTVFLHHIEIAKQLGILRPIADQFMRLPLSEFLLESEVSNEFHH